MTILMKLESLKYKWKTYGLHLVTIKMMDFSYICFEHILGKLSQFQTFRLYL
jgi:hypothetical protein